MTDFTLSQQLQTDAALAKLDEVFAFQFQEELEEVDFAEALPESADPEELDRMAPALIRYLIQSSDKGYKDVVDRLEPIPNQSNNWLYDTEGEAFKGRFIDERPTRDRVFSFVIKKRGNDWERTFRVESGDFEGDD